MMHHFKWTIAKRIRLEPNEVFCELGCRSRAREQAFLGTMLNNFSGIEIIRCGMCIGSELTTWRWCMKRARSRSSLQCTSIETLIIFVYFKHIFSFVHVPFMRFDAHNDKYFDFGSNHIFHVHIFCLLLFGSLYKTFFYLLFILSLFLFLICCHSNGFGRAVWHSYA